LELGPSTVVEGDETGLAGVLEATSSSRRRKNAARKETESRIRAPKALIVSKAV